MRVLLIQEAECYALYSTHYMLKTVHCSVTATTAGELGIRHAEKETFDIVLVSAFLPLAGTLIKKLREANPDRAIVAIMPHRGTERAAAMKQCGADACVEQFATGNEYLEVMRSAVEKHRRSDLPLAQ